ncbi:MAG: hypothetical protein KDK40_01765 [Chlamydiia bacterium]|nr:hypothetical protein [Chlamydiia bacterium]
MLNAAIPKGKLTAYHIDQRFIHGATTKILAICDHEGNLALIGPRISIDSEHAVNFKLYHMKWNEDDLQNSLTCLSRLESTLSTEKEERILRDLSVSNVIFRGYVAGGIMTQDLCDLTDLTDTIVHLSPEPQQANYLLLDLSTEAWLVIRLRPGKPSHINLSFAWLGQLNESLTKRDQVVKSPKHATYFWYTLSKMKNLPEFRWNDLIYQMSHVLSEIAGKTTGETKTLTTREGFALLLQGEIYCFSNHLRMRQTGDDPKAFTYFGMRVGGEELCLYQTSSNLNKLQIYLTSESQPISIIKEDYFFSSESLENSSP